MLLLLFMLGSSPAAFLFLALAMTSDTSLGLKFSLEFGWLSDKRKDRPAEQGRAVADFPSVEPTENRVGCRSQCLLSGTRVWFGVQLLCKASHRANSYYYWLFPRNQDDHLNLLAQEGSYWGLVILMFWVGVFFCYCLSK